MILENTIALIKFNCDCDRESGRHTHTIFNQKENRMSLRFVPPKVMGKYAIYIDDPQSSRFKVFNNLGTAKQSLRANLFGPGGGSGSRHAAKVLELVDGEWFTLYDIPVGTTHDDFPWMKEVTSYSYSSSYSGFGVDITKTTKRAAPMTREEYAEWRVKVDREQRGSDLPV